MDNTRREELRRLWNEESEAPETMDWRDELTPEELDIVSGWDRRYDSGMLALCSHILLHEEIRRRFRPQEILELEDIRDHCRVRLRDGRLLLARLTGAGELRLDEIDGVC